MNNSFQNVAAVLGLLIATTTTAKAQSPGNPISVPVKFWSMGNALDYTDGTDEIQIMVDGVIPTTNYSNGDIDLLLTSFTGTVTTPVATAQLMPNRLYSVDLTVAYAQASIYFAPPPGYTLLVNGTTARCWTFVEEDATYEGSVTLEVVRADEGPPLAGVCTQIESGMVGWKISMGGLLNGSSAGFISIMDTGTESSWASANLFTPAALQYQAPSTEIVPYYNSSGLRQILGDQADADIEYTPGNNYYTISFYNPAQLQGTAFPYSFVGQAFVVYTVSQAPAGGNAIQIQSTTYETTASNYNSGPPAARSATTTLTQTGTGMNSYTWTLQNWNTNGQTQLAEEVRQWGGTSNNRTEALVVSVPSGATATTISSGFTTEPWGEVLTSKTVGGSGDANTPVSSSYAYYSNTAMPGDYGFINSRSSSDGTWEAYDYYGSSTITVATGMINDIYRPFVNSSISNLSAGQVITFTWAQDAYGAPTRHATTTTTVNGTETGYVSTTYNNSYGSISVYDPLTGTTPADAIVQASTTTNTSSSGTLASSMCFFAENDIDTFFANQVYCTVGSDGVQQSYAYQRGTFNASNYSFTASTSGNASSIAVITGSTNSSAGSYYSSYNGFSIAPLYLVDKKSTMQVTIRDPLGLVRSQLAYVWLAASSSWQLIDSTDCAYDFAGNLVQTTKLNGGTTSAVFNGEQAASTTDVSGVTLNYTYDAAGRMTSTAKAVGGAAKNLSYDAANRVLSQWVSGSGTGETIATSYTFDDAGRLLSVTPPGQSAINYSYSYSASGNSSCSRTETHADTGTRTDAYQPDGRLASTTGTAVVPTYYTYALDGTNTGYLDTTVNLGASNSVRQTVTVTDWLGRPYTVTKAGFSGGTPFVTTNSYNSSGQLASTSKTGFANTLYVYDYLSNLIETGLDINANGTLDASSNDRITAYNTYVYQDANNNYWLRKDTSIYPTSNNGTALVISSALQRLTGFSASQLQETQTIGEYAQDVVDDSVTVNTSTQTLTETTTGPGLSNPQYTYIVNGLRTKVTGADALSVEYGYDALERLSTTEDTRSQVTTQSYNYGTAQIYQVSDTSPATIATYGYDSMGRRNSITDALSNTTSLTYNPLGEVLSQGGTGAYPVSYGYDVYGARTSMSTEWGSSNSNTGTTWAYDAYTGLLASKTDQAGNAVTYTYNPNGSLATRAWARRVSGTNVQTTYAYDANTGQLTGKTYNDGTPAVSISYAGVRTGQITSVTDAAGTRTFNFDATYGNQVDSEALDTNFYFSRVLTQLYETSTAVSSSNNYNGTYATGTVQGRPCGFELGISSNPSRDVVQQLVRSNLGQLVGVNATNGTSATRDFVYSYVSNAELISGYTPTNANSFAVNCAYDSIRPLLTTIQGSTGGSVVTEYDYTYNAKRQRTTATQKGSAYADYFSGASYSSVYNSYTYDSYGELTKAIMNTGNGSYQLPGRSFQYQFDLLGNRTSAGETSGSDDNQYGINDLNQYTSVENEAVRVLGNCAIGTTASVTGATTSQVDRNYGADYFPANQSSSVQGSVTVTAGTSNVTHSFFIPPQNQTPTYDADGNLASDGVWTYSYDAENRLISMASALPAGQGFTRLNLTFTYDYLGRRVEKKVVNIDTSTTTYDHRYIYAGWNLICETDTSGDLIRSFTWGPGGANSAGSFLELTNFNYNANWVLQSTTDYFGTSDGNGNVASLVRYDGEVAAVYEYGPFGETLRRETPTSDTAVSDNPIRFASYYTDSETGLVYYGQRYYNPAWGRFINRDPIGELGGANLYAYCRNDGVNRWDFLGLLGQDLSDQPQQNLGYDDPTDTVPMDPIYVNGDQDPNGYQTNASPSGPSITPNGNGTYTANDVITIIYANGTKTSYTNSYITGYSNSGTSGPSFGSLVDAGTLTLGGYGPPSGAEGGGQSGATLPRAGTPIKPGTLSVVLNAFANPAYQGGEYVLGGLGVDAQGNMVNPDGSPINLLSFIVNGGAQGPSIAGNVLSLIGIGTTAQSASLSLIQRATGLSEPASAALMRSVSRKMGYIGLISSLASLAQNPHPGFEEWIGVAGGVFGVIPFPWTEGLATTIAVGTTYYDITHLQPVIPPPPGGG